MSTPLYIVLPCYNPFEGWETQLAAHVQQLRKPLSAYSLEVVLVNDASKKNVEQKHIDYLQHQLPGLIYISYTENKGKGYALRKGIENITGGLIVYTDIDFPYQYESMVKIVESLEQGNDIAIGTRNEGYYENTPKRRTLISKVARFVFKVVYRLPITDTQCGLKGFNQKGKSVFLKTSIDRFLFDMEFIAIASKTPGVRMEPVHVELRSDVVFSKMNIKILTGEFWNFIKILRIVRRHKPYA
ncbi:MAG TPA: glycosyltransferase family 2 protein [Bacteroidia bacterium]|nr:glycosyltransferase family 2 protein [Bacteroidia bacterium]